MGHSLPTPTLGGPFGNVFREKVPLDAQRKRVRRNGFGSGSLTFALTPDFWGPGQRHSPPPTLQPPLSLPP